jgi:hypothetical protein
MKKIIFPAIMALALFVSLPLAAQDAKKEGCCKAKTECPKAKKEAAACCKAKSDAATASNDVKNAEKKAAPAVKEKSGEKK